MSAKLLQSIQFQDNNLCLEPLAEKMQSPAETGRSDETDPGKAEASGVAGLSAEENNYRSNKRAASSPLPSSSTSTPFNGVKTNFGGMSLLSNPSCSFVMDASLS